MKYFLLLGGFAGFAAVLVSSFFFAGNRPAVALRDAAIACLIGGFLFRMLHSAYIAGIKGCIADKVRGNKGDQSSEDFHSSERGRV
jgi:hypothetical protein